MSTSAISKWNFKAFCVVLLLSLGPVWAAVPNPYTSTLVNNIGGRHELGLVATVTYNQATELYHYEYTLNITASWSRPVSSFSVGNPNHSPFMNAGTDKPINFNSPANYDGSDLSKDSVFWASTGTTLPYVTGGTARFWFDSPLDCIVVSSTVTGSWGPANGSTLGIAAPEPASIAGLMAGIAALGASVLRKKR